MPARKEKEITREQQIAFLKKISFFNDFDDHELRQFLSVSKWLKVPAEKQIIKEETTERIFYILVKGEVSVFKTSGKGKKSVELTRLQTGDCFGEMSLVMDVKRTAGVKTTMESFLLMVEPDIINTSNVFLQLKFYKRFCEILVSRLIMANKKVAGQKQPSFDELQSVEKTTVPPKNPVKAIEKQKKEDKGETVNKQKSSPQAEELEKKIDESLLPPVPSADDRHGKTRIQRLITPEHVFPINRAVSEELQVFFAQEGAGNTRKLAELIGLDLVLSAKVLQVANSSFFRRSNPVISIPHAMVTLGIEHIQESVTQALNAVPDRQYFSNFKQVYKKFWHHAIIVGRIAEMLREVIRLNTHADLYLAGLLHDIGMLSLDILCPTFYAQTLRHGADIQRRMLLAELQYIGTDHATAGCWLAEKMGIPQPYLTIMQYHHDPQRAREHIIPVALIHLADLFAARQGACLGKPDPESLNPLDSFAWIMLQDQHKPFMEVNVIDFISSFEEEIEKSWESITSVPFKL